MPPPPPLPPVQASSGWEWYYCRSAWYVVTWWDRLMFGQMYPLTPIIPMPPWCLPGRGIWWPRVVWTCVPFTWAHVLLSAVFNRPSWVFKVYPHPQYRHLVLKNGTTAGPHDIWSGWGSGWCLVRCTLPPHHPHAPSMPPPYPQYRHLVTKRGTTSGQIDIWSVFGSGWPVYVRVNLVPAAAVIPSPWADIIVVAVKKLICCCLHFSIDCL